MKIKGLIKKLKGKPSRGSWQPANGPYPRLKELDDYPALKMLKYTGGLYALWHRGVRPQWIYIGYALDLCLALSMAMEDPDIKLYERNDGVFFGWAECPQGIRAAAVKHLRLLCEPAILLSPLDELGAVDPKVSPIEFPPPID